jgi:hypothetical protein
MLTRLPYIIRREEDLGQMVKSQMSEEEAHEASMEKDILAIYREIYCQESRTPIVLILIGKLDPNYQEDREFLEYIISRGSYAGIRNAAISKLNGFSPANAM